MTRLEPADFPDVAQGAALSSGELRYKRLDRPLTYAVVARLKRLEHSDAFDRNENFNPFIFSRR